MYTNPLGLLEHVGKVVFFLAQLHCLETAWEGGTWCSCWMTPAKVPSGLSWTRLEDPWKDPSLSAPWQSCSTCTWHPQTANLHKLKHLGSSGFLLVFGSLYGKLGFLIVSLILCAQFWGWCNGQSRAFLGLLRSLLRSFLGSFVGSFLALTHRSR